MTEQKPEFNWGEYNNWYNVLSPEERQAGRIHGRWPEGTPPLFAEVSMRMTPEDRLLRIIFREESFSLDEILSRPADYLRQQTEKRIIPPPDILAQQILQDHIENVFASLTDRERQVLRMRFGLDDGRDRTLVEIGKSIGRSRSTAWRIEHKALAKLRELSPPPEMQLLS